MNLPILDRHHVVRKVQNGPEETICKTGKGFGARLLMKKKSIKCLVWLRKKLGLVWHLVLLRKISIEWTENIEWYFVNYKSNIYHHTHVNVFIKSEHLWTKTLHNNKEKIWYTPRHRELRYTELLTWKIRHFPMNEKLLHHLYP